MASITVAMTVVVMFAAGAAGATVLTATTAPFAKGARVPPKVKAECGLSEAIPKAVADHSADVKLVASAPRSEGRTLELVIGDIHAPGGGAFSGPKWMEVKGTLRDRGKAIGSFRAKRYSTFPFAGTCGILARIAKALGADIAGFLENPSKDATLGDAR